MAGIESVTTQMAGIIPLTAVSGVTMYMAKGMFSGAPGQKTYGKRRARKRTRARSRSRSRKSFFGGTSPY